MTDWLTKEQRSHNMSRIRSSGTTPERRLGELLRTLFPGEEIKECPALPGKPDYFLPAFQIAVFSDGCFWHGCPRHGHVPEDNRQYWSARPYAPIFSLIQNICATGSSDR